MLVIMRLGLPLMVWPSIVLIMLQFLNSFCLIVSTHKCFGHLTMVMLMQIVLPQLSSLSGLIVACTLVSDQELRSMIEHKLPKTLQAFAFACYPRCNGSINHGLPGCIRAYTKRAHILSSSQKNIFITAETWALRTEKLQLHKRLLQGLFGAPSAKPTTLLVTSRLPQGASIGKDKSGKFKTSPLKEYPPGFCRAIAQAFLHDMCTEEFDASTEYGRLPSAFLEWCTQMHARAFGNFIGKDWLPSFLNLELCPNELRYHMQEPKIVL